MEITSERTTNSCESFQSKLNSQFTKAQPNIFIFTHVLNTKTQTDTYIHKNGININTISENSAFNKKKKKKLLKHYQMI
ncbi:MULE domain-containing protein [Aphis craccivora]|uniref:MULE domain-containing protein n=1 Tax=Aphis craccivora TaxID=307492 RepID=A0A6G0W182_APHCR|nr:MULE domain-containing protein [Aphis craccivora]